jgi:ammonium transporter, Amt family
MGLAPTIDIGSTAFMLFSTALVMIMTPGLALFYGGLVGRKNVLGVMIQSFFSMAWTTFLWWAIGYSLVFSGGQGQIIGNFDHSFLIGINPMDLLGNGNNIPLFCFIAYQMMFAIITPALITGAFANRIRFNAYMVFLTLWLIFVYFPIAHNVWGGGLFSTWGVLDYAGGTAVHISSGFAALASVYYVGKRRIQDKGPHSIPLVAIGTALLWFGWYGFNAGSELKIDSVTSVAFINTDIAASIAAITWLLIEWVSQKKPKFVGLLTGAVAGLVAITPGAGYVSITGSVFIGFIASCVCYLAIHWKNKHGLDDALDVWGVHGMGGFFGCLLTGVFAVKTWNPAGADGLLMGNTNFFLVEALSAIITAVYSFAFTYCALWLINKFIRVKVSAEEEEIGLDMALHGEEAYM